MKAPVTLRAGAALGSIGATAMLLASGVSLADAPPAAVLTVRVSSLHSDRGQVGCMIFGSARGFPTDPSAALQKLWCPIDKEQSACAFAPIPAGTYAVACFHDENKNGKLDTGLFGIPTEGTVASNQAHGFMGPPSFEKARFSFAGVPSELRLRMEY